MSKYLFLLSHPAHFHMFKLSIKELEKDGHKVIIVVRPKDVLEQLCVDFGFKFIKTQNRPKKYGLFGLGLSLIGKTIEVWKIVQRTKPDLLIGSDGVLSYIGFIKGIPSFEWYEDDAQAIKLYAIMFFPFYTYLVSPKVVDAWLWKKKKIGYDGYQKMAYLHPNIFTPNVEIKNNYIIEEKYFILRFSALTAHHDVGIKGFDEEFVVKIIKLLSPFGKVYISSEKELLPNFQKYALKINPLDIHHVLFYSTMLIGDTQSMCGEAALLGVPSIRYSSFVGKLSVLEELEHKYKLTFGFKPGDDHALVSKIIELLKIEDIKVLFQKRRQKMLADKIDVSAFFVWFIENYPESAKIMKADPDYQNRFK